MKYHEAFINNGDLKNLNLSRIDPSDDMDYYDEFGIEETGFNNREFMVGESNFAQLQNNNQ